MKLEDCREKIDKIDKEIMILLGRRFKIVKKVAFFKKRNNLRIEDKSREKEVLEKVKTIGTEVEISHTWLLKLFRLIIQESKKIQKRINSRIDI